MNSIIYIDKEPNNLYSFHAYFRRKIEYDYFMCITEEDAFSLLIAENIKILICDQPVPELTGMEFLQELTRHSKPPILISISGHHDLSKLEEAMNKGEISCYLNKPLDYEALHVIMQKLLSKVDM
ncbi:MAG: response regulator [Chitinophagaceae bacterium]|nr:response regulator [Chitinophagaceae bacterium]